MRRSAYSYVLKPEQIEITDLNLEGFKSVTNDMEQVLRDIHLAERRDLTSWKIIYRDSCGNWDGVKATNRGSFQRPDYSIEFYPVQKNNRK